MLIKLSISERLLLLAILPNQGNIVTTRLVDDLKKDISFNEDEIKKIRLEHQGQNLKWDPEAVPAKTEFEICNAVFGIVKKKLTELNDKEQLTSGHVSLYEKFVETGYVTEEKK